MKVVHAILSPSGDKAIAFYERTDGSVGFESQVRLREENTWVPDGQHSDWHAIDLTKAVSLAMKRVPWFRDEVS